MKKSKIIAPALAVLTLSTAAAVTGTVAWFTASRVKNITMNNITAINPESGLELTLANVKGTSITGTTVAHANNGATQGKFRDGSVNVVNGKAFGSVLDEAGNVVGYKESEDYTAGTAGGVPLYHATAFDAKFNLSLEEGGYAYNLFFDAYGSTMAAGTATGVDPATEDSIMKAIRVGLAVQPSSGAVATYWVWAPNTLETKEGTDVGGGLAYVAQAATGTGETDPAMAAARGKYYNATAADNHAIFAADEAELPSAEIIAQATAQTTMGYLGTLPYKAETQTYLTVRIYTWFEGLDQDCINEALDLGTSFTANLKFKMYRNA